MPESIGRVKACTECRQQKVFASHPGIVASFATDSASHRYAVMPSKTTVDLVLGVEPLGCLV